jgi:hypothetical protein
MDGRVGANVIVRAVFLVVVEFPSILTVGALPLAPLTILMPELPPLLPFAAVVGFGGVAFGFVGDGVVGQPAAGELPLQLLVSLMPELPPLPPCPPPTPPFGSTPNIGGGAFGLLRVVGLMPELLTGKFGSTPIGSFGLKGMDPLEPELLTGCLGGFKMAPGPMSAQGGRFTVPPMGG